MLVLESNQICPFSLKCPYNNLELCYGARADRNRTFVCNFVNENGEFLENQYRNQYDQTGKMKIILEGDNE